MTAGTEPDDAVHSCIRVRGASVHNLKGIDVDIPRDAFVVVTGVSGSGKSSLAFGTIYAEAQLRYLESVAPYARRLIEQAGAPEVDSITGLPPAVALRQTRATPGSRSSVGTVTTLSNALRMLYSRAGSYPPGAARLDSDGFSRNTAAGACPTCHGLGQVHDVTEASLVPDPDLSIRDGAVAAWPGAWLGKSYRDILRTLGHDIDRPWRELPQADRDWILFTDDQPVVTVEPIREAHRIQRPYQGTFSSAKRYVLHTLSESRSGTARRRALQYVVTSTCTTCDGTGLRAEARSVTVAGRTLPDLASLPVTDLIDVLGSADGSDVAVAIVPDIRARVDVMVRLGLGYLSIDRPTPTLSAGELQRLRLATALRSQLFGVVYVLDEPSAGLHPDDTESLLVVLDELRRSGNSLIVVEHDLEVMRHADWLVDVGPGAGTDGGHLVHSGPVPQLADVPDSRTRPYLIDPDPPPAREPRPTADWLGLRGVTRHNLKGLDVDVLLAVFTALTGVSGSGKTTLIDVLGEALRDHLGQTRALDPDEIDDDTAVASADRGYAAATGTDAIQRVVQVDQRPIGRTPRSNLATYTGLFDRVRTLFAGQPAAKARGYSVGRFSFNVKGGRCENCEGAGYVAVELLFLPSTYSPCPVCHGRRYNQDTLSITYRDASIADVLDLTVDEATDFFGDQPSIERALVTLQDIGLGYLTLGQPATELSGGEAQRIKLATELQRRRRGHTVYVLDEPTTGLHPADVEQLRAQLDALVEGGNTVVVAEHDLSVIAAADHVIDLGPGGGADGGTVVAAGTPAQVAGSTASRTARYLARWRQR
ncbi:excinuclease ABC subunit UvrA [Nakamurella lactea]|uniref:excinuclease ABC subunit UvrA n=1 Tax=Nakamurella lactea TaxID=459515 RepID=UPI0005608E9D|nr:excinuclease ABC subunit UvrA [Nakamurella lactea]